MGIKLGLERTRKGGNRTFQKSTMERKKYAVVCLYRARWSFKDSMEATLGNCVVSLKCIFTKAASTFQTVPQIMCICGL